MALAFTGTNVRLPSRSLTSTPFRAVAPRPFSSAGGSSSSREHAGLSSGSPSPLLNVPSVSGRTGSRTNVIANAAKVTGKIKLALTAGKANPAPPVGPALGSKGVNIMAFCKEYNAQTAKMAGQVIPVEITVYEDRSFTFILKTPPASVLLKKAAGIESGSGKPNKDKVGKVTRAQVAEIAKTKLPDTNATKVESVVRMIEGTAKNMGITLVD